VLGLVFFSSDYLSHYLQRWFNISYLQIKQAPVTIITKEKTYLGITKAEFHAQEPQMSR
jgi:hypothetical protein